MDASDKLKYLKVLGLILLAIIVFFPDVVFELTIHTLEIVFEAFLELTHILFEGLESVLDHIVEALFETELHSTQTIVFYILLSIGIYLLYRVGRMVMRLFRKCQKVWNDFRAEHKLNVVGYWRGLTVLEKVKWVLISSLLIYLYILYFI